MSYISGPEYYIVSDANIRKLFDDPELKIQEMSTILYIAGLKTHSPSYESDPLEEKFIDENMRGACDESNLNDKDTERAYHLLFYIRISMRQRTDCFGEEINRFIKDANRLGSDLKQRDEEIHRLYEGHDQFDEKIKQRDTEIERLHQQIAQLQKEKTQTPSSFSWRQSPVSVAERLIPDLSPMLGEKVAKGLRRAAEAAERNQGRSCVTDCCCCLELSVEKLLQRANRPIGQSLNANLTELVNLGILSPSSKAATYNQIVRLRNETNHGDPIIPDEDAARLVFFSTCEALDLLVRNARA